MSERKALYADINQEELDRIAAAAQEKYLQKLEEARQLRQRKEDEFLTENMLNNSELASSFISKLPERCFEQAKLGLRELVLFETGQEDWKDGKECSPGKITSQALFRYGTASYFLVNRLLEAGFTLEARQIETCKNVVLVMIW